MSCGVGRRRSLDPALLWLWHRLPAVVPIRPLAWELPYALGMALKKKKKKKATGIKGSKKVRGQEKPKGRAGVDLGLAEWTELSPMVSNEGQIIPLPPPSQVLKMGDGTGDP